MSCMTLRALKFFGQESAGVKTVHLLLLFKSIQTWYHRLGKCRRTHARHDERDDNKHKTIVSTVLVKRWCVQSKMPTITNVAMSYWKGSSRPLAKSLLLLAKR